MKTSLLILLLVLSHALCAQDFNYLPTANGELIQHTYYAVSYMEQHEQPEWVAYYLAPDMLKKVYDRKNSFKDDPAVSTGSASYADYKSAAEFDAGHLLPCRQMQFDCDAMAETFYMSNMSPQRSEFNRYKWASLENLERNMAWRNNGIYVVTGPVLSTVSGTIGVANQVSIPEFYYKVFLKYDGEESKAIAFVLPNRKTDIPVEDFVVSIDFVEALTGIDFFPQLEDSQEAQLEAFSDKSQWSFSNPYENYGYTTTAQKCTSGTTTNESTAAKININTATKSMLETLPGIGTTKAQAIIDKRPFQTIADIRNVSGIGQTLYNNIADLITVD